jgi:formylglycine-generating enzyme required for sulfatase activity
MSLKLIPRKLTAEFYPEALSHDIALEMVLVRRGTFTMGSPDDEPERSDDEGPQHDVTVPDFFMGKYLVTQEQWRVVADYPQVKIKLDRDPSYFKGDCLPVEQVSWNEAVEFCDRLIAKTGRLYQLPSEAQWEYACRAGTQTPFAFGKTLSTGLANYDGNQTYNHGPKGEDRKTTIEVGTFYLNAFGLYDMSGNVYEWCADDWHENYDGHPIDGSVWNASNDSGSDPESDPNKVFRGGSWVHNPRRCRSAFRLYGAAGARYNYLGFRVMVVVPAMPPSILR